MKIYRVWQEQKRTPNPIMETHLDEETVTKIAEKFPDVNYFFMED